MHETNEGFYYTCKVGCENELPEVGKNIDGFMKINRFVTVNAQNRYVKINKTLSMK